ncbi:hypothetical protein BpHYR1_030910 [Brachionus plicatilis]|uniref:Uncharacterized protein n=1 Tax=Brachionus plicatilis TaxID=10195 RepID=A0A3M7QSA5_BRAPC|nr:hypothetical protein BpHYR1_030910 [Brachionus plicatilis]
MKKARFTCFAKPRFFQRNLSFNTRPGNKNGFLQCKHLYSTYSYCKGSSLTNRLAALENISNLLSQWILNSSSNSAKDENF